MDIVRYTNFARLTIFSFLSVLALSACLPDDSSSSSGDENEAAPSGELKIIPPANRQSEATGVLTIVSPGRANAQGGVGDYTFSNNAPGNGFPLGTTTVTWTVVDGSGARASGTQIVSMSDTTPPAVSAPPSMQM
ncbi:MAG: HYR domain-containing protein, partial [Gammaproteobacteria bacterium]